MKRDPKLFVKDIYDACDAIQKFVLNLSFDEFIQDDKTLSAVIRKFEVIGEAAKNVPEEIKIKYPECPWKEMSGMRDRLIHAYFGIDNDLVWDTIQTKIPELMQIISGITRQ
jgi:uncharacterized protein with HEPN domain